MYKVAYEICRSQRDLLGGHQQLAPVGSSQSQNVGKGSKSNRAEAAIICNYATFIYRHRRDPLRAKQYFLDGVQRYPKHKGLQKNFAMFLIANKQKFEMEEPALLVKYQHLIQERERAKSRGRRSDGSSIDERHAIASKNED